MPRIFKGIESELRLLLHPCILTGEITDIKVALFTNDPSVAIEFTDRYTIDDNILTLTVPTWAFGTMEDGVINYVIQGMHNDDAFITDRQSNYYLKTPTDYIPEEMPKEVVLGELTTMIVENGVFEYTPSDVDAWNKATIEVNVPDTNGSFDEGYDKGKNDGYDSGYQDGYNQGQADCPEGGDNYNRVFANTFELQQYMEAQGITELNGICVFGTVGAIQNISDGKATYFLDSAMVVNGSRFDYDPDFDETKLKEGAQIALKGDVVYNADAEYVLTINNSFLINYELGQAKRYTATSNGSVYIDPDYDKGYTKLNTVILDVEVEGGANLSEFYGRIKENGTYEYLPSDTGVDGFSKVTINANIPTPKASVKTEAEVKSIIDTEGKVENVYIQGAVTEIEQYRNGRLTFWIGGLRIGNAKDVGGINFTDENKIKVGDNVIIFSTSGMYAIARERYEFSNCELIAICANENGGTCNLIKESFSIKGDYEQFTASDYGADGFESVTIDAYDYGKQKFNEGYEEGKNQGGTVTAYPTIKDIYNTEDVTTVVNFKGTVAVCLPYGANHYMVVTDHTGAIYLDSLTPCDVGDECVFTGVLKKSNTTNIRYMNRPTIEVLSKGNYVVMPTDAVELTNKDELYIPNEYGNAEMKYLYYQGEIKSINSTNGNIIITTPESVSSKGQITLKYAKEEWRSNLVVGDNVRMYMFTTQSDGNFLPTDIIKLGTEGECPELTTLDVEKNGTYEGAFGIVNVNVSTEGGEGGYDVNNAVVLEVTENGTYTSKYSEIEWDEPATGIYNDGTEFYSYANLATTVYDTGIPATQDSKLEFWWKSDNSFRVNGTVVGAQHFNGYIFKFVEYSTNQYKIEFGNYKIGGLFSHTFEYDMTSKWAHISLSKKDGLVVDGQLICTIDGEKWGDNQAIPNFWINTSYDEEMGNTADGSFGMIKINDTVIIPTENGFLNTSTNELLTMMASGAYEYKNLEVPVAEGELMKTIKVNVPMKLNPNKMSVSFGYSSFSELPEGLINWNSVTDMQQMFRECKNLQSLNVESKELKDLGYAFYNCSSLSDLTIDTSNVNSLNNTFYNCKSLPNKFFETLDTSKVTDMNCAFQGTAIETFSLDTSNVINMYGMFQSTYSTLKKVNPIDTSKVTNMSYMFYDFSGTFVLEELPEFDCSNVNDMSRMFSYYQDRMPNFTTCGGWKNLSCNWNDNYGLRACANLSYESCINILNGLADVTELGGRTLKVHQNFLDLVGSKISIGVNKGWTITA